MVTAMKRSKAIMGIFLALWMLFNTLGVPAAAAKSETEGEAMGNTYYVSSSSGSDANDGVSAKSAWKSFEKVKALRLKAGDRVLLKRGDIFHERLEINAPAGTAQAWVYVGPYGDLDAPAPVIDMLDDDNMDDICVLVQDLVPELQRQCNYVWIDNLTLKNAVMGIYFRYACTDRNEGIRVTDCTFEKIRCDKWDQWLAQSGKIGTHDANVELLSQPKGGLPSVAVVNGIAGKYLETGGGAYEYFNAATVRVGGVPRTQNVLVSDIEMQRLIFENCTGGIDSCGYWTQVDWGYTKNWSIKDVYTQSGMLFSLDCVDCGWDGTENSRWGIFENLVSLGSVEDMFALNGTTIAGLITGKNCLIRNSIMNNCKNNGGPDGCGFDFERNNINVHLQNCIFAKNDGQGVLMMELHAENADGSVLRTPNKNCSITNCLFYNNLRSVFEESYCYDIQVWNDNNENITVKDNLFVFNKRTAGGGTLLANAGDAYGSEDEYTFQPAGPYSDGILFQNNELERGGTLPPYDACVARMGLTELSKQKVTLIQSNETVDLSDLLKGTGKPAGGETPDDAAGGKGMSASTLLKISLGLTSLILLGMIGTAIGFAVKMKKRGGRA